jgi:hypothetical protein
VDKKETKSVAPKISADNHHHIAPPNPFIFYLPTFIFQLLSFYGSPFYQFLLLSLTFVSLVMGLTGRSHKNLTICLNL